MSGLTPVIYVLAITIIAVESWWIWFSYPQETHISFANFLFLEIITLGCLVLCFFSIAGKFPQRFIFFSPLIPVSIYFLIIKINQFIERQDEEKKLKVEILKAIQSAGRFNNGSGFERAGDIYLSRQDFDKALIYYRKAREIRETPEIVHKINVAKQEILLKQKKLWICPECSITNSSSQEKCRSCGALKPSIKAVKHEILRSSSDLKKNLIFAVVLMIVVSFFIWYIKNASFLTSFIFFSVFFVPLAFYFLYKIFSR